MASVQKHPELIQNMASMDSIEPASILEANLRAGVTNESHLQSLGFTIDNGRPRFKIDEPVENAAGLSSLRSGLRNLPMTSNLAESEEESFVVLGKDSLSYIQASSMASYADIQRKSTSTDYNSIISSLTAEETEKKLRELLQENVKLKETLNQNNLAMKRQFNTLVTWQEEITKVHQSHKQKFRETKELIIQLRKENSELKIKASNEQFETNDHTSKIKELQEQLQRTDLAQQVVQSVREIELESANSKLIKELEDSKSACQTLVADIQRHKALSTRLSQQLKQADVTVEGLKLELERLDLNLKEKEQLASLADYSLLSGSPKQTQELESLKENVQQQDREIKHLRELIASLEQQLKITSQNSFPSIEILTEDNSGRVPSEDRLQFIKNVKQYNDVLKKLSDSYAKQGSSYVSIQESLKESMDIIQDLERTKRNEGSAISQQEKFEKLEICRSRFNDERLEMINERQELIKAQNQFQKVFSDYNSVLYELEIMHEENAKLSLQDNNTEPATQRGVLQTLEEKKENSSAERESLEILEASILQERADLLKEKLAREALQSECESLKTDLSRQKLLNEAGQKSFAAERKDLVENIKDLTTKNHNLEELVKSNAEEIDNLKTEMKTLKGEVEKLPVLQTQLQIYEADFLEERQARQQAVQEKDKILEELQKFQKMHKDLLATIQRRSIPQMQQQQQQQLQQPSASAPPPNQMDSNVVSPGPVITAFSCPKCSLSFTALRPLEEHVERCLELQ